MKVTRNVPAPPASPQPPVSRSREEWEAFLAQSFAKLGLQITGMAAAQSASAEAFNVVQAGFNQYQDSVAGIIRENAALHEEVTRLKQEAVARSGQKKQGATP